MTWTALDMSDRISIDELYVVTNQNLRVGHCMQHPSGQWVFRSDWKAHDFDAYKVAAPYVVKFIDKQLLLLNLAERLKS